jgi:hypothetical protein
LSVLGALTPPLVTLLTAIGFICLVALVRPHEVVTLHAFTRRL